VQARAVPRAYTILRGLLLACLPCAFSPVYAHPGEHQQLENINQYIARQPNEQVLYIRRASLYSTGGHFEQAAADLARAETLGPPVEAATERGLLHLRQGEVDLAILSFDRYIKAYPSVAITYEYRARAAREAGNKAQAVADLKQSIALRERAHPGIYLAAADLLHEMRDTRQAILLLDEGLEKLGPVPTLQRRAIELVLGQGETANAIARWESLRTPLRESPAWKLEMASLLLADKRVAEAQSLLAEVEADLQQRRTTPANLAVLDQSRDLRSRIAASTQANPS
jgi:tetratricopeptide (TPR) repeat protein